VLVNIGFKSFISFSFYRASLLKGCGWADVAEKATARQPEAKISRI
jgi:hypothetical protein